jgi:hypothetical protein
VSSITHSPRTLRARVHTGAAQWLVGAILVASVAIVLLIAVGGSDADRTAPAASPAQAAPAQVHGGAPDQQTNGPTPCCGPRL